VSEKLATRALYEAGEARTVANRRAFVPQTLTFSAQVFFSPCTLPQERYNCGDFGSKKEIPA
jgi:hypothetical protein